MVASFELCEQTARAIHKTNRVCDGRFETGQDGEAASTICL